MQKWEFLENYEPNIFPIIREFFNEIGGDINKHCLFYIIN